MKLKKALIRLRLLADDIAKYKMAAFFGVAAQDENVQNLWKDYNEIRRVLFEENENLFDDLNEVIMPEPTPASSFSHHDVDTLVYQPDHFIPISQEVEKAIKYSEIIKDEDTQDDESQEKNITISVSEGSTAAIAIGTGINILQNTAAIDKILEELESLGVETPDLQNLKDILAPENSDVQEKSKIGEGIMKWFVGITKRVVEKGLLDNLPVIQERVQSLIEMIG